jgi:ATP-binding cassette subfamily C protein
MKPKIISFVEKKNEFYKITATIHDFMDILNMKHHRFSKTIAWNNNYEMYPNLFVLEDVTLKYETKDGSINTVLENVNLKFQSSKAHFIYGNSGCGKTTILSALMKRIKIFNGVIKFMGIYDEYKYFSIRQYLTYMTSESALFHKDLHYNIIYGIDENILMEKENEVMETITKYMSLFGLEKFIPTMKTTNAHKISKGQTQRVAIVRLFMGIIFKGIRILFLDEFTSNIDNKMEEIIYTELRNIQKIYNFTTFYVSHNIANKKYSDYSYEIDVDTHSIKQFKT